MGTNCSVLHIYHFRDPDKRGRKKMIVYLFEVSVRSLVMFFRYSTP